MLLHGRHVESLGPESNWNQQRLHRDRARIERSFEPLVHDALVRGVHVHDYQAVRVLREHVDAAELGERKSQGVLGRCGGLTFDGLLGQGLAAEEGLVECNRLRQTEREAAARRLCRRDGGARQGPGFGAPRLGGGACMRLSESKVERVKDELMHGTRVAETHLGFGGMHVDVHQGGVDVEEEHVSRMPLVVQHVPICLTDGVRGELVPNVAPVDEEILRVARAARLRGQPDRATQAQGAARRVHGQRRGAKVLPEQGTDTLLKGLRLQVPPHAVVVLQRERKFGARKRHSLECLLAMRVLGRLGSQKFAARRCIEVEVAHLDGRPGGLGGGRHLGDLRAIGGDRPCVLVPGASAREREV